MSDAGEASGSLAVRAACVHALRGLRGLCNILLGWVSGDASDRPFTAVRYLNIVVSNREVAVRQQVGELAKDGLQSALGGNPITAGMSPFISNAWGELIGNMAAASTRDEDIARSVGESLAKGLSEMPTAAGPAGTKDIAQISASVCFVHANVSTVRVAVEVSPEGLDSLFLLSGGTSKALEWRDQVSRVMKLVPLGESVVGVVDACIRTAVANAICHQLTDAMPNSVTESLRDTASGLSVTMRASPSENEAACLFDLLGDKSISG